MAAAENSFGDSDILVMGDDLQSDSVHVSTDEQQGTYRTVKTETQISGDQVSNATSVNARGVTDYNPIDLIVECTQYDESLQECLDRLDSEQANFEIGLANAILNAQYLMITEQTEAMYNMISTATGDLFGVLERIEKSVQVQDYYVQSWQYGDKDGGLVKSLKFMGYQIYDAINKISPNITKSIDTNLRVYSGYIQEWGWSGDDGNLAQSLEWQNWQIYQRMDSVRKGIEDKMKASVSTSSQQSWYTDDSDNNWLRAEKWMLGQLNSNITRNRTEARDNWGVSVSTNEYESWTPSSSDSPYAKMLKWQSRQTNLNILSIPASFQSMWQNDTDYGIVGTLTVGRWDSPIIKFWKQSLSVLNESIKKIKPGGGGSDPAEVFKVFEDSLKDFQKSFDKMVKYLKDFEFTGEGGTNLWDVLETMIEKLGDGFGDLIDGIGDLLDFTENLMDFFIEVFVPKENVIKEGFEGLQEVVGAKFQAMSTLTNVMETTFSQPQREFDDVVVSLPKYGTVTLLKTNFLNQALPVTRNLIGGFLVLVTSIWAYRKITSELIT